MGVETAGPQAEARDFHDPDVRWQAVVDRDRAADGIFVYAVRSTGIYCRPSCRSRLALRRNVSFHDTPAAARAAGFRACKRCEPDEPCDRDRSRSTDLVIDACRAIDASDALPDLARLAARAGVSRFHFHRLFKAQTGLTPRAYTAAQRARRVRDALRESRSAKQAAQALGFRSSSRFHAAVNEATGMTSQEFRAGGAGRPVWFAVAACRLGSVLVAATERGVCAIALGDDPTRLADDLRAEFPTAQLEGADPAFQQIVEQVARFVDEPAIGLDLPLDIQGTAFQQRVWQALREIPAGETSTYTDIAHAIEQPRAVRAVARACASNRLAVVVPCHRVVRADGSLSGYRWGVERKRALLEAERMERREPPDRK